MPSPGALEPPAKASESTKASASVSAMAKTKSTVVSSPAKKTPAKASVGSYISASTKVPGMPMSGITTDNSTMTTKFAVKARLASGAEVEAREMTQTWSMIHYCQSKLTRRNSRRVKA